MAQTLFLNEIHQQAGATFEVWHNWVVPWRYQSLEAEYVALRRGVGLIDLSVKSLIEVRGADRVEFLQNLLSNDIKRLLPGAGCRAALLAPNAKLIAELLVLADADALWLLCDAARAPVVAQTLERYHFTEAVTVVPHDRDTAVLALEGPRTIALLTESCEAVVTLLGFGDHAVRAMQGVSSRLIRHPVAGGIGVWCVCRADDAPALWQILRARGTSPLFQLVGWEALNIARIEAGIPWYGIDMDESNLLPETGLEAVVVSDTKGCYVGQEIVARMKTYGSPNQKLMGLLAEGAQVPARGDRIRRNGKEIGRVTSACFSLRLSRPIAMGYLKRSAYEPGTAVKILRGNTPIAATVTTRPFVVSS